MNGHRYYITFIDDHSKFTWIFPLTTKSQALNAFKYFKLEVETLLERKIKILQANWGGEYRPFLPYLIETRIYFRHPCPYTYQENGTTERKHRHITEFGLTLLV